MRMGSEVLRCVSGYYMFLLLSRCYSLPYLGRDGTLTTYEDIA